MTGTPELAPRLAVALTGAQVLDAVQHPELWRRLHATGVAFVVIGIDRLADDAAWGGTAIDSSVAATYLADDADAPSCSPPPPTGITRTTSLDGSPRATT